MPRTDHVEKEGVLLEACGGGKYKVALDEDSSEIIIGLNGKMRRHRIRVMPGDRVRVALSPADMSNGMIVYRYSR
jgi:translation initiation factor IF-1